MLRKRLNAIHNFVQHPIQNYVINLFDLEFKIYRKLANICEKKNE